MIKVINNQKRSIGFDHIKALNVIFESGINEVPLSTYMLLEDDTYFKWYVTEGIFTIERIEEIQHSVIEQSTLNIVDTVQDSKVIDWDYIESLDDKTVLDKLALDEYGIKLDGRKSYTNMVISFKEQLEG